MISKRPVLSLSFAFACALSLFALGSAGEARADLPPKPAPSPSSQGGQGATTFTEAPTQAEEVSGLNLMVAAYIVMWVLLGVYVTMLLMRSRKLDGELHELRARLDQLDRSNTAANKKS